MPVTGLLEPEDEDTNIQFQLTIYQPTTSQLICTFQHYKLQIQELPFTFLYLMQSSLK